MEKKNLLRVELEEIERNKINNKNIFEPYL